MSSVVVGGVGLDFLGIELQFCSIERVYLLAGAMESDLAFDWASSLFCTMGERWTETGLQTWRRARKTMESDFASS